MQTYLAQRSAWQQRYLAVGVYLAQCSAWQQRYLAVGVDEDVIFHTPHIDLV